MTEIAVTASTDPGPSLPEPLLPELPLPALPLPEPPLPEPHTATELTPDADARLSPPGWPEEAAAHLAMPGPDLILAGPDDALRGALLDSRQRWRDLVMMTADFAFETDEWGRFVFVVPDPAIGWPTGTLVGQPWTLLIPDCMKGATFNPFRCTIPVQRRRAWLRRGDGGMACVVFAAAPLLDASGRIVGTRGLGVDLTDHDQQDERVTAALRRGEVLDHILLRVGHEVLAPRMMRAALDGLANALGAEGCGVIVLPDGIRSARVLHESGHGAEATLETAAAMLDTGRGGTTPFSGSAQRAVLALACHTRFGDRTGLAVWRAPGGRPWDEEDRLIAGAASSIVRMVLEQETIQQEMARQARTDPLTGLLNRRAFLEELERRTDRLDREGLPGTLMFADLDNFKPVNDLLGHEVGDQVLIQSAVLLRRIVRPSDLVARLGGDEFAVWLDGADHMTAAERAEHLREVVPGELAEIVGPDAPLLGMSIGIAAREPGTSEPLDGLMRRADMAMYDVKRNGRGHWRVSLGEDA